MITALEIVRAAMDAAIPNFGGSPVDWKEEAHPRTAKGGKGGGQFAKKPETLEREDERDELNPAEVTNLPPSWLTFKGLFPVMYNAYEKQQASDMNAGLESALNRYQALKGDNDPDCNQWMNALLSDKTKVQNATREVCELEEAYGEASTALSNCSPSTNKIIHSILVPQMEAEIKNGYDSLKPLLFSEFPTSLQNLEQALDAYEKKQQAAAAAAAQKHSANPTVSSAVNSVLANLKGGGANGMTAKILNALANGGAGAGQAQTQPSQPQSQQSTTPTASTQPQKPNQFGPKAPLPINTPPPNLPLNSFDSWQSAGSGSTHPHKINVNGEWYFAKRAGDNPSYTEDAAQNEVSANSFLRMAGLNAPESWLMKEGNEVFCVTKGVDTHKELTPNLRGNKALAAQVREAYPIMALVYNTDVMKNSDNAFIDKNGDAVFVDNGSTFGFSAQGVRNSKRKFGFDYDKRVEADSNKNIDSGIMALAQHPDQGAWRGAFTMGNGFTQEEVLKEAAKYNMADLARAAVQKGFVPKPAEDSFVKFAESLDALSAPYKAQ